ncbi:MAG: hypothetical protein O2969_02040 [Actinomycetota bacterium]|nr:hypothetical protein [Actinomycetota bacterium]
MPDLKLAEPVDGSSSSSDRSVTGGQPVLSRLGSIRWAVVVAAAVVVAVGVVLRWRLLGSDRGDLLADEAFTGLLSAEILDGYLPVMIAGIGYTAPVESYLYAPVAAVFGMSVPLLKMVPVVLWACSALIVMAGARRIIGRGPSRVAGVVAWFPPGALLAISFRAYEGYASGLVICAVLIVYAMALVSRRAMRAQPTDAAAIGGLVGLLAWVHPIFLVVALPTLGVLTVLRWRAVKHWWLPMIGGGVCGAGLLIAWNAKNGWPSLSQPADATEGVGSRFVRLLTELVPRMFGVRTYGNEWIVPGVVAAVVIVVAVGLIGVGVRRLVQLDRWVAAVIAAPLLGGLPLMSLLNNASITDDGRYGIVFVVPMAIAVGASTMRPKPSVRPAPRPSRISAAVLWPLVVVAVWFVAVVLPWSLNGVDYSVDDPDAPVDELVEVVRSAGFDRLAGYYWAVLPAEFVSDQDIRVATAGHPPVVLLAETQREVESTPPEDLAMVFLGDAPEPLLRLPLHAYDIVGVGNWKVYLPAADVRAAVGQ